MTVKTESSISKSAGNSFRVRPTFPMKPWKVILFVYRRIDVRIRLGWFRRIRFTNELLVEEEQDALNSFRAFPALAEALSNGEARINYEIVTVDEPLSSITPSGDGFFWPSPNDTRRELDAYAVAGQCDSVFVFWPRANPVSGRQLPCAGWGLGAGPSEASNGATYAVVGNAPSWAWNIPVVGEVWLHEWLHGVCRIFAGDGFAMPEHDADGGGSHGYVQSKMTGWTDFYRDLMTGRVLDGGERTGITAAAWRSRDASSSAAAATNDENG
jgi:hypothetical protein